MAFVVVIPVAAWLAYRYEKRIEETQVLSIVLSMMILTVAGAAGSFTIGSYAIVALNVIAAAACVASIVKNRNSMQHRDRLLHAIVTPGAAAYLVLCGLMFVASYGRYYASFDEFHYWAPNIRNYYMTDQFGSMRYLEISAVWDLFATRMWLRLSSGMMMLGQATMILAYLVPVYADSKGKVTRRSITRWLLLTVMIWMLPMFGAGQFHGYVSLYADMFLGAGMIYTLVSYIRYRESHDPFYYVSMMCGLASVVLGKQAGLILGAILLFVMAGTSLAANPSQDQKWWLHRAAGVAAVYIVAAVIALGVPIVHGGGGAYYDYMIRAMRYWPLVLAAIVLVAVWVWLFVRSGSRLLVTVPFILVFVGGMGALAVLKSGLNLHQVGQVAYSTCKTFMDSNNSHLGSYCPISDYMLLNIVFVLGAFAEVLIYGKRQLREILPVFLPIAAAFAAVSLALKQLYSTEEYSAITFVLTVALLCAEAMLLAWYLRKRSVWFAAAGGGSEQFWLFYFLVIGCILYMVFYFSGMLTSFGEPEEGNTEQTARSLWRYMFSYMAPLLFTAGYLLLRKEDRAYAGRWNPFWCVFVFILLDADLALGVSQLYDRPQELRFTGMEGITLEEDASVCIVDMNADNEPNIHGDFYYQAYPVASYKGIRLNDWFVNGDTYGTRMTPNEVAEMLTDDELTFDYVYLRYIDLERGFAEYYADLFEDSAEISSDRLYRVETADDGAATLEYVPRQVD